jgi:hypothetical protein
VLKPGETDLNLEDNILMQMLLGESEDKSLRKEIAQKIQKFYFGDKPVTTEAISSIIDVSQCCWFLYTYCKLVLCACETWPLTTKEKSHIERKYVYVLEYFPPFVSAKTHNVSKAVRAPSAGKSMQPSLLDILSTFVPNIV